MEERLRLEEQLKQHMDRLFAAAPKTREADDLKEEMLQNVIDKYHDLLAEGKAPEEAYRTAIRGIGDISGLISQLSGGATGAGDGSAGKAFDAGQASNGSGSRFESFMGNSRPASSSQPFEPARSGLSPQTKKAIWIILGVVAGVILIWLLGWKIFFDNYAYRHETGTASEKTESASEGQGSQAQVSQASSQRFEDVTIRKIKIEWVAGEIEMIPGDCASFEVKEPEGIEQKYKTAYELSGDTLVIREYDQSFEFSLGINLNTITSMASKHVMVTVPETVEEVEIETVSSPVMISGDISLKKLDVEMVAADVNVAGVTAREIEVEGVSGDFSMELLPGAEKVEIEMISGDINLYVPEDLGFTMETESVSGDTNVSVSVTNRGDTMIAGDGSCKISLETVSGEMNIRKLDR